MLDRVGTWCRVHKRACWTLGFCVWLCVIWGHSLASGEASSQESSFFVSLIEPLLSWLGVWNEHVATHILRKMAHFCEHGIMTAIAVGTARAWWEDIRRMRLFVLCVWVLVPCVDETIQLFVPERAGSVFDVLLDMAGGLLGMLIAQQLVRRKANKVS